MDVTSWLAVVRVAVGSSPSVTNEQSAQPTRFPKSSRLLKPAEFRKVYDNGARITCAYFAAFCRKRVEGEIQDDAWGPRFGFTTPKALGKAVVRNRIKRRMREAVRLGKHQLNPTWEIVFNPRRSVLEAQFPNLIMEVERLFRKCNS